MYRRADVERVLQLKHLLFVEGLTLAGARRKLAEQAPAPAAEPSDLDLLLGADVRERLLQVKRGLRELQAMLSHAPRITARPEAFELQQEVDSPRRAKARPRKGSAS